MTNRAENFSLEDRCQFAVVDITMAQDANYPVWLQEADIDEIIDMWATDPEDREALSRMVWDYVRDPKSRA